ncbi:hypothetical protein CFP56_038325 [Quercus suber]|uniref:Uncharacterized protein n=1 Tax=Quercus suber TaxID=58331 RepID=A0AAW0LQC8_QUESU
MENWGLTEFKFIVGHDVKRLVSLHVDNQAFDYVTYVQLDQSLRFINGETIPNAVVLSEFGVSYFIGLRLCAVRECAKIQTIIASMELSDAVSPVSEHLIISYLSKLTMIYEEMIPQGCFAKLSIDTFFSNSEELIVERWSAIEEIIFQDQINGPN